MSSSTLENPEDENSKKYPVSDFYTVEDGYDIERRNNVIVALVVVSQGSQKALRLYRWRKKGEDWKVDLCRMDTKNWNWEAISKAAQELKQKHNIPYG